jgi:hypothetical protein
MSSITNIAMRNQNLQESSIIYVNGYLTNKLDFLGSISIHGRHYFNVFRRYNSAYEIVFEDYRGELHFHRDHTMFQSIQRLLCLTEEQMQGIHVISTFSFKHNGRPAISDSFLDMHWSAIQANWQGLIVNLGGILDYHSVGLTSTSLEPIKEENSTNIMEEVNARLDQQDEIIEYCRRGVCHIRDDTNEANQELNARLDEHDEMFDRCRRIVRHVREDVDELREEFETPDAKNTVHYPDAPEKALHCIPYRRTHDSNGVKRQRLTDRFAELETDTQESELSDDWEVEISCSEEEEEEEEDDNYLELRSGQKYYK